MATLIMFAIVIGLSVASSFCAYNKGQKDGAKEENTRIALLLKCTIAIRYSPTAALILLKIKGKISDNEFGDALEEEDLNSIVMKYRKR